MVGDFFGGFFGGWGYLTYTKLGHSTFIVETIQLVDLMLVLGAERIQDYVPDVSYRYNVPTSIIVVISSVSSRKHAETHAEMQGKTEVSLSFLLQCPLHQANNTAKSPLFDVFLGL